MDVADRDHALDAGPAILNGRAADTAASSGASSIARRVGRRSSVRAYQTEPSHFPPRLFKKHPVTGRAIDILGRDEPLRAVGDFHLDPSGSSRTGAFRPGLMRHNPGLQPDDRSCFRISLRAQRRLVTGDDDVGKRDRDRTGTSYTRTGSQTGSAYRKSRLATEAGRESSTPHCPGCRASSDFANASGPFPPSKSDPEGRVHQGEQSRRVPLRHDRLQPLEELLEGGIFSRLAYRIQPANAGGGGRPHTEAGRIQAAAAIQPPPAQRRCG